MLAMPACSRCPATHSLAASMNSSMMRLAILRGARVTPVMAPNSSNSMSGSGRSKSMEPRRTRFLLRIAHQLQGFFDVPVDHLYAAPVFTAHYRKKNLENLVVVAPDVGSAKMARGFAKRLNGSLAIIDKRRPKANFAEVVNVDRKSTR